MLNYIFAKDRQQIDAEDLRREPLQLNGNSMKFKEATRVRAELLANFRNSF